jgi:Mg-chelatase subunit ChlD
MKDEYSNPLGPVGDESIEARIVAWVLGDASAFEAAELERLCEERPELLVFRRRMEALHGLLEEGEQAPAEEWKLPAEKRARLEELFGSPAAKSNTASIGKKRHQPWLRQTLMAVAACVALAAGFQYVFKSSGRDVVAKAGSKELSMALGKRQAEEGSVDYLYSSGSGVGYTSSSPVLPPIAGPEPMAAAPPLAARAPALEADRLLAAGDGKDAYLQKAAPADLARAEKRKEAAQLGDQPANAPQAAGVPTDALAFGRDSNDRDILTGGLRSGDGAITRNNIDAILNNPDSNSDADARVAAADGLAATVPATPLPGEPTEPGIKQTASGPPGHIDTVSRSLYMGEGAFNLGKFEDAKREFEEVIRVDPYNQAARRWLERVASAKSDYYRAAYDHTRAELLAQVDASSELAVPGAPDAQGGKANQASEGDMEALRKAVMEQEDIVADKLKALNQTIQSTGFIPTGDARVFTEELTKTEGMDAPSAREVLNRLEQEKRQLATQIEGLQHYSSDQLLIYASGLNLPENRTRTLYPEYLAKQRALGTLKSQGLSDRHPLVKAQNEELKKLKRQLDEATVGLKETLKAQLAQAERNYLEAKKLSEQKDQAAVAKSTTSQDYLLVKDEYDRAQAELTLMKNKLQQELLLRAKNLEAPAPPKPAPVPTGETSAAEEPFSTFSLHVSDASFKLAKAALDRGERPTPEQIRVEEFYNAFDYGDAAPAPGEEVACTIEQSAHPILPQRNLVRVAMRVGSTGRGEGQPLNLTILLDKSGSMERDDRHAGLKAAMAQLATLLTPNDTVTLAGFSRTPHLLADRVSGAQAAQLVDLVDRLPSEGGTNLEEALKLAGELALQRKNPAAQNRIVLLTDGAANLGDARPELLAQKIAGLRQQGIAFDAAGIGAGGLNDRMLETLTRQGNGRYYVVNDAADADENFARQLAGAFRPAAENVKVQVRFNPARVARYKLIGFEKHRLNKEDFRNDAVDAAELAADEAGVALYQVEVLPEGEGELGEVSVRFRDTTSGGMVDRSWTMRHDAKVTSFDQARPSMQLAGLALLAAEKLRGGPMAEAIDFSSYVPQSGAVQTHYDASPHVRELTEMIRKLR